MQKNLNFSSTSLDAARIWLAHHRGMCWPPSGVGGARAHPPPNPTLNFSPAASRRAGPVLGPRAVRRVIP